MLISVGLLSVGFFVYTRYIVPKSPLGGACTWAFHCGPSAPRCMKQTPEGAGVCSRPCAGDPDCAEGIRCVRVELDERDERGVPLEGGYCFPQTLIDARKAHPAARDAGAPRDVWLDVPQVASQFEGELVFRKEAGSAPAVDSGPFLVKGTLVRGPVSGKTRALVDASTLRVFMVDDASGTFSAMALAGPPGDPRITRTGKKDRVAGVECELWEIEGPSTRHEACVVQGGAFVDPSSRSLAPWQRELAVRGVLPLRVVQRSSSGHEESRLVATRVDVRPVDPALFSIPRSYKNQAPRR